MTKQPELPDFYRDSEIVQSLNRSANPPIEAGDRRETPDVQDMSDGTTT